jgi:hypothetical protein
MNRTIEEREKKKGNAKNINNSSSKAVNCQQRQHHEQQHEKMDEVQSFSHTAERKKENALAEGY